MNAPIESAASLGFWRWRRMWSIIAVAGGCSSPNSTEFFIFGKIPPHPPLRLEGGSENMDSGLKIAGMTEWRISRIHPSDFGLGFQGRGAENARSSTCRHPAGEGASAPFSVGWRGARAPRGREIENPRPPPPSGNLDGGDGDHDGLDASEVLRRKGARFPARARRAGLHNPKPEAGSRKPEAGDPIKTPFPSAKRFPCPPWRRSPGSIGRRRSARP